MEIQSGIYWRRAKGLLGRVVSVLPGPIAAALDTCNPNMRNSWGGAFNGQEGRVKMVKDVIERIPLSAAIETGTFRGTTTEFLRRVSGVPVFTVEKVSRPYYYSRLRFFMVPDVHVLRGDSRRFLERAASDPEVPRERVLFYLDAHWEDDLPLGEELHLIARHWRDAVVIVDDFQVPDDIGYGFDDYGSGKRLSVDCFPEIESTPFSAFWPAMKSGDETGARRGCVVLALGSRMASDLSQVPSLRARR